MCRDILADKRDFDAVEIVHENGGANIDTYNLAESSIFSHVGRYVWFLRPPDGL